MFKRKCTANKSKSTRHGGAWGERRYSSYSFTTSALDGGEWSESRPGRAFTLEERTPGTHCTGGWVGPRAGLDTEVRGKILCPCRGSNPCRPARSQTLYCLSYPVPSVLPIQMLFADTPTRQSQAYLPLSVSGHLSENLTRLSIPYLCSPFWTHTYHSVYSSSPHQCPFWSYSELTRSVTLCYLASHNAVISSEFVSLVLVSEISS
jgi:hypothetical protein